MLRSNLYFDLRAIDRKPSYLRKYFIAASSNSKKSSFFDRNLQYLHP
ncbi:MAG: hypothetical protein MUE44_05165 [Oscillatoriaceae cyanobacterium Prado104]|nr:hypothetical protein [Oscillatoriaceae cyanobacterium Prado104]